MRSTSSSTCAPREPACDHAAARAAACGGAGGEAGLVDDLPKGLLSLDESITLDERRLVALNLSEFKSAAEKDEL